MYVPRQLEAALLDATKWSPVIMLTGPRQSGKTTLLRHLSETGRTFASLDDLDLRRLARTDPALFIRQFRPPVLIDEFQYAPELLVYIKIAMSSPPAGGMRKPPVCTGSRGHSTSG